MWNVAYVRINSFMHYFTLCHALVIFVFIFSIYWADWASFGRAKISILNGMYGLLMPKAHFLLAWRVHAKKQRLVFGLSPVFDECFCSQLMTCDKRISTFTKHHSSYRRQMLKPTQIWKRLGATRRFLLRLFAAQNKATAGGTICAADVMTFCLLYQFLRTEVKWTANSLET